MNKQNIIPDPTLILLDHREFCLISSDRDAQIEGPVERYRMHLSDRRILTTGQNLELTAKNVSRAGMKLISV